MRKGLRTLILIGISAGILTCSGCNYLNDCGETTEYPVKARLSVWNAGSPKDTAISHIYFYAIVSGEADIPVYEDDSTSVLLISMNPAYDHSSYIFKCNLGTDTIYFNYQAFADIVSYDCGLSYVYNIESVSGTHNIIDSIAIDYPKTNTGLLSDEENIRIYF